MEKNLKTYRVVVNPEDELTGVYAVSLVDQPAIEVDWIKLGKVEDLFFSVNKDKQMLFGPLLIPNKLILRKSNSGELFNIMFDAETIQIIADKYNESKINDIFNFQHSDKQVNAVLLQNWITGEKDKSQDYGFDLPAGSWFAGVKVKDEEFWLNEVKTDKVKGFSIEVKADVELIKMTAEADKNESILLMNYKTKDGVELEGDIAIGSELFIVAADGTKQPAEGEYELEDGTKVVALAGKVVEAESPEEEAVEEDMADEPVSEEVAAPAIDNQAILDAVAPMFEEFRTIIADLSSRLDALENVAPADNAPEDAQMSKIEELEEKLQVLSLMAGAPSVSKKSDTEIKREKTEEVLLSKINFFKRK